MTEPEFTFIPDWGAEVAVNPNISAAPFGDGYVQRMGKGINSQLNRISLTFSGRTDGEAEEILGFFRERGGVAPFTARIGFGSPIKKYVTEGEYKRVFDQYGHNSVSVVFQEVP
ncbi:MAG: phage tail protein [Holophagaceae bacterium]|nr:phage tail protein [Holophagaceae bacterium]